MALPPAEFARALPLRIVDKPALTDADQERGLLGMRRAITARRICADGPLEAFVRPRA
jgi:hypothetical protein